MTPSTWAIAAPPDDGRTANEAPQEVLDAFMRGYCAGYRSGFRKVARLLFKARRELEMPDETRGTLRAFAKHLNRSAKQGEIP